MRILFLSASLASGGTERQIVALARGLRRRGHQVAVAVFYGGGSFEAELRADGVPIHDLGRRGRWDLSFWPRLARLVRAERPEAILAYLGGPNVISASLKPVARTAKIVWGVRAALADPRAYTPSDGRGYDWLASVVLPRLEGLASTLADAVVTNSHAARRLAIANGMDGGKIEVIPNGIDCDRFRPDDGEGRRLRREWGVPDGAAVVGMVARIDPVKNHAAFLRAAARVAAADRRVRFVCVGGGDAGYRRTLEGLAAELALGERLVWAGERVVTRAVYGALDVAVLSSDSESFPNVVAEAMACGTPVVVADSGDVALLVGGTGVVVPPRDPEALARGILETLARPETTARRLRDEMRGRIEREFSLDALVARTERTLERVVRGA